MCLGCISPGPCLQPSVSGGFLTRSTPSAQCVWGVSHQVPVFCPVCLGVISPGPRLLPNVSGGISPWSPSSAQCVWGYLTRSQSFAQCVWGLYHYGLRLLPSVSRGYLTRSQSSAQCVWGVISPVPRLLPTNQNSAKKSFGVGQSPNFSAISQLDSATLNKK